ncbi:UNVERIFIED_CONTAM: hypothetical protein B566_EDAN015879 [Ephemera danica]|nr:hypothetical protein B566_EDAN015879 [Ephemera danica]
MSMDAGFEKSDERKIRFRVKKSQRSFCSSMDSKVDDFYIRRQPLRRWQTDDFRPRRREERIKAPPVTLCQFLRVELTRDYMLEQDEDRFTAKREKIYTFFKIPRECADSFLFVFTFLPMRFILAFWALVTRPFQHCFGARHGMLKPAEVCDVLKGVILICCSIVMTYIDTSMMYHLIKSQSIIKLYIFYNMLEVGDRLFSAFGQDTIDSLLWTATEPRGRKREHFGVIPHLFFAALYFVELKGSVFKKFDKNNLFQVSCSDVRERFHLSVLLFIVMLQTMKEYSWKEERFWVLLPDCLFVLLAELLVDWIKHAFITRFNELPVEVYRDYTTSLAYDTAQTRQKHAIYDHSDLVARRMGFIPLPLGVVMIRVLVQSLQISSPAAICLLVIAYLGLASFRILNSIVILGKACDLMSQFESQQASPEKPTTPIPVGTTSPAIFSNSSVQIDSIGLNERLQDIIPLREDTPVSEVDEEDKTPPDSAEDDEDDDEILNGSFLKKRTRSEPSICISDRGDFIE